MSDKMQQHPEVPVIVIEHDEQPVHQTMHTPLSKEKGAVISIPQHPSGGGKWRWWLLAGTLVVVFLLLLAGLIAGLKLYRYNNIGVPISTTPEQNIAKLQQPLRAETSEVILTTDTVLGVPLDFYALHGLKASIQFEEPDLADESVYLYTRCADHTADGQYLGSLVAEGQERQSDCSRLGYMGMADGRMVIGISRSDAVKDYVQERGGSFFRQFILVSNGVLPPRFYLHGKVERRAIGRKDDTLYYVATRHRETLWDFADALREYGFVDAIYITGGNSYSYYRTADGRRHDIGDPSDYPHLDWPGTVPWLVFRKLGINDGGIGKSRTSL
ncbi:MAG: phosphodiester glycosidase family protein [Prevotella sp.]|nr:phosphodiester glycosidase family protein [Prevotella sp.]MBR1450074.1 phosphodiester glycosidase family protein [Prevotella sp.]